MNKKIWCSLLIVLGMAFGMFSPVLTVLAKSPDPAATPIPTQKATEKDPKARLETLYQKAKEIVSKEENRFEVASKLVEKIQQRIERVEKNGKDATPIKAVLMSFKGSIDAARLAFDKAKNILEAHQGFDANGKVIDETLARQTLKEFKMNMQSERGLVKNALSSVKESLKALAQDLGKNGKKAPKNQNQNTK
jgi:hypothetical protein